MPPRHMYWTILIDGQPTAFRAAVIEDLLPTFNRLKQKHPSAVLKWFERGRLWESRDEARKMLREGYKVWSGGRLSSPRRPRAREEDGPQGSGEKRGSNWRPGGEHRDPRERYKLAKKDKWRRFKQKIRERAPRRDEAPRDGTAKPGDPPTGQRDQRRAKTRPPGQYRGGPFDSAQGRPRRRGAGRKPPKPRGGR